MVMDGGMYQKRLGEIMKVFNLLSKCTTPTLTKEYLSSNKDMPNLKEYLIAMLEPTIVYGLKKIPSHDLKEWRYSNTSSVLIILREMQNLSGKTLKSFVGRSYAWCTPEMKILLLAAIKRKHPNKIGVKVVNSVFPGLIFQVPYMGCLPATPENLGALNWSEGVAVQKKEDGMAVLAYVNNNCVELYTRQHKKVTKAFPEICAKLGIDYVASNCNITDYLHMEFILFKDNKPLSRKEGNGIFNKIIKGTKSEAVCDIRPVILDKRICGEKEQQYKRYWNMSDVYTSFSIVEQTIVETKKDAKKIVKDYVSQGYEGAVFKDRAAFWKNGKHKNCLKVKPYADIELIVYSFNKHKEKPDLIGSLICMSEDGELRVAVSGLSDKERKKDYFEYWNAKIITVRANDIISSKTKDTLSLLNPRFIEIREDKLQADSVEKIKTIFEGLYSQ